MCDLFHPCFKVLQLALYTKLADGQKHALNAEWRENASAIFLENAFAVKKFFLTLCTQEASNYIASERFIKVGIRDDCIHLQKLKDFHVTIYDL